MRRRTRSPTEYTFEGSPLVADDGDPVLRVLGGNGAGQQRDWRCRGAFAGVLSAAVAAVTRTGGRRYDFECQNPALPRRACWAPAATGCGDFSGLASSE